VKTKFRRPNFAFILIILLQSELSAEIWLNEIMVNPIGSEYTDEFIELINPDSTAIDLANWLISDGNSVDLIIPLHDTSILNPGVMALIFDPGYNGFYDHLIPEGLILFTIDNGSFGSGGFSNSQIESVLLIDSNNAIVDSIETPISNQAGFSYERTTGPVFCQSCWQTSNTLNGSPGAKNTVVPADFDLSIVEILNSSIKFKAKGIFGFIGEIFYSLGMAECVEYHFTELILAPQETFYLELPEIYPLNGQNPLVIGFLQDTLSNILLDSLLWNSNSEIEQFLKISEIQPDSEKGGDWCELFNPGTCPIIIDGFILSWPGSELELLGSLPPKGYLLIGDEWTQSLCSEHTFFNKSIRLNLSSWLSIDLADTIKLETAVWQREMLQSGRSLERLSFYLPAGEVSSWISSRDPGKSTPGCPNITPAIQNNGRKQVSLSSKILRPNSSGFDAILRIDLNSSNCSDSQIEVWGLNGKLQSVIENGIEENNICSFFWELTNTKGDLLLPGTYIVRICRGSIDCVLSVVCIVY
jgi:hypothetical protein